MGTMIRKGLKALLVGTGFVEVANWARNYVMGTSYDSNEGMSAQHQYAFEVKTTQNVFLEVSDILGLTVDDALALWVCFDIMSRAADKDIEVIQHSELWRHAKDMRRELASSLTTGIPVSNNSNSGGNSNSDVVIPSGDLGDVDSFTMAGVTFSQDVVYEGKTFKVTTQGLNLVPDPRVGVGTTAWDNSKKILSSGDQLQVINKVPNASFNATSSNNQFWAVEVLSGTHTGTVGFVQGIGISEQSDTPAIPGI